MKMLNAMSYVYKIGSKTNASKNQFVWLLMFTILTILLISFLSMFSSYLSQNKRNLSLKDTSLDRSNCFSFERNDTL